MQAFSFLCATEALLRRTIQELVQLTFSLLQYLLMFFQPSRHRVIIIVTLFIAVALEGLREWLHISEERRVNLLDLVTVP